MLTALLAKPGDSEEPGIDSSKFSGSAFVGYGMSIFEEDLLDYYYLDDGPYIPIGVKFLYEATPRFKIGSEFEFCASPFALEGDGTNSQSENYYESETDISMTTINFLGQFYVSEGLYIRAGVARYSGTAEIKIENEEGSLVYDEKTDIEPAFGFNGGIGYEAQISENAFAGIEGVYHKVDVEFEEVNYDIGDLDFSHWAVHVFVGTNF